MNRPAPIVAGAPTKLFFALLCTTPLSCQKEPPQALPVPSASSPAPSVSAPTPMASTSAVVLPEAGSDAAPTDGGTAADFAWLPKPTVVEGGTHKLAVTSMQAWVRQFPDDETPALGYLRAGAIVDRSPSWISKTLRCKKGWYEVLPRGYVCDGNRATLDPNDPVVLTAVKRPARGQPLPYAYVRPNGTRTYLYFKLPSKQEQRRTEVDLRDNGHVISKTQPNLDLLPAPEPLPSILANGGSLTTPYGATTRLRFSVHEGRAKPEAAFALVSTHEHEDRLFGLTTEHSLLAIDRVKIVRPSTRVGAAIEDLPAGIVNGGGGPKYRRDEAGTLIKDGTFTPYQVLDLTGKTHMNTWETRDGYWVAAPSIMLLEQRTSFPSFVGDTNRRWIDISIKDQVAIAYEGKTAKYVAQVSTGLGGASDPEKTFATIRGSFTIKAKHVTATMTGSRQAEDYELADVPYVQYFHEGYALHAAFWHDDFGRPRSHGCVNLTPADAVWFFEFTDPTVPPHWHGATATPDQVGSVVNVRY